MNKAQAVVFVLVCVASIHALTVQRKHYAVVHQHAPHTVRHRLHQHAHNNKSPVQAHRSAEEEEANIELNIHKANVNPNSINLPVDIYGADVGQVISRLLRLGDDVTLVHGFNGGQAWKNWIRRDDGEGLVMLKQEFSEVTWAQVAKPDGSDNPGRTLITASGPRGASPLSVLMRLAEDVDEQVTDVTESFAALVERATELTTSLDAAPDADALEAQKDALEAAKAEAKKTYDKINPTYEIMKTKLRQAEQQKKKGAQNAVGLRALATEATQLHAAAAANLVTLGPQLGAVETELENAELLLAPVSEICSAARPLQKDLQSAQASLTKLKKDVGAVPTLEQQANNAADVFLNLRVKFANDARIGFTDKVQQISDDEKAKIIDLVAAVPAVPDVTGDVATIKDAMQTAKQFCESDALGALRSEMSCGKAPNNALKDAESTVGMLQDSANRITAIAHKAEALAEELAQHKIEKDSEAENISDEVPLLVQPEVQQDDQREPGGCWERFCQFFRCKRKQD